MFVAGEAPRRAQRLIDVTYEAMMRGIEAIRPGGRTGDIGFTAAETPGLKHGEISRSFGLNIFYTGQFDGYTGSASIT